VSYSWAFGDGTTSTLANPSHTYSFPGTYVAVLTVTDNQGAQAASSVTINAQQDPAKVPDLIVSSVGASVSAAGAGASITVTDTTKNQGTGPAAPSTTFIYFSLDAILDPGDTLIGTRSIGVLGSGSSIAGSTVVTIPANAAMGTRYLIVRADGVPTVGESNEANNTRTKSITVTGPDLYVSALSATTREVAGSTFSL
jgi:PKD repeat protein